MGSMSEQKIKVYLLVVGISVNGLCWIEENRYA